MTPVNVICIKWGDRYPPHYVNRLYRGVARFLRRPFRFICFTENPEGLEREIERQPLPAVPYEKELPLIRAAGFRGAWPKVSLYRAGLAGMEGLVLGLDLDVVVTGPLDDLFDFAPGKVCMRRDWVEQRRGKAAGNSSVFRFEPSRHGYIYDEFAADPWGCVRRVGRGEQRHTSLTALAHGDLEYFPPAWIASFKRDAMPPLPLNFFVPPKLPPDARVMCFHGLPKMEDAMVGRGKWYRRTRPAPWLAELWVGSPG